MLLSYTSHIVDDGVILAHDVDFEIDIDVELSGSNLAIDVVGVYAPDSNVNLMTSPSVKSRTVGCDIADKAQSDDYVIDSVMQAYGLTYVGGHNNPGGRFVRGHA